jgi:phage terminase large subunit
MAPTAQIKRVKTNKVFQLLTDSDKRITSLRGGTRSGKTYNVLIWFVMRYLQTTGKTLTIARQTMPALKASAMRDFFEILEILGLYSEANHNKTRNEYTLNGNLIEFIGASEPDRVRGRKRDDLFINEVNEITYDAFRQLAFRTTGKIVVDYNPSDPEGFVYDHIESRDDCDLHVTTYQDNPFLEPIVIDEIERLQDSDDEYWKIYGLGLKGSGASKVWTHWREIAGVQYPYDRGQTVYGLDFGFNNPSALTEVTFYDNTLHWREMLYQSKLTNSDLITALKAIPEIKGRLIIADAAEPQRIEEIRRAGFKIQSAYKVIKDTVDFVKSKPLRIHSESVNLLREVKRLSWKTDKNGALLDEIVKFDDHLCDAGRYASFYFNQPKARFYSQ